MLSLHVAGIAAPGYSPYTWDARWEVYFVSLLSQRVEVEDVLALLKGMLAESLALYADVAPL